jgi:hypothetical protein
LVAVGVWLHYLVLRRTQKFRPTKLLLTSLAANSNFC